MNRIALLAVFLVFAASPAAAGVDLMRCSNDGRETMRRVTLVG
jgi:hypothetical protein